MFVRHLTNGSMYHYIAFVSMLSMTAYVVQNKAAAVFVTYLDFFHIFVSALGVSM